MQVTWAAGLRNVTCQWGSKMAEARQEWQASWLGRAQVVAQGLGEAVAARPKAWAAGARAVARH